MGRRMKRRGPGGHTDQNEAYPVAEEGGVLAVDQGVLRSTGGFRTEPPASGNDSSRVGEQGLEPAELALEGSE